MSVAFCCLDYAEKEVNIMKKMLIVLAALCLMLTAVLGVVSVSADTAVAYGDLDGSGKINNRDLALLQQHINGWDVEIDLAAADVDGNGKVNNRDLALLQQYINGWDVTLGPDEPDVPDDDNIFNDTELDWS